MEDTQTKLVTKDHDIEELIQDCTDLLKPMLKAVRSHYFDTEIKSSCQLTVEFNRNKEDELVIKYTPKKTLPIEIKERTGEFNKEGELQLI